MPSHVSPPVWVLAALPVLVVVAVDPRAWSPYGPAKWAVTAVTATAGAGWMIAAGRVRLARRPAVAGAALLVVAAMAAAFGRDPLLAWIGTTERHFGALTWLLLMLVFAAGQGLRDEAERRVVQLGFVVAGAALGVVGAVELAGWQVVDLDASSDRITAAFGSAALLGAATCLLVPVCAGIAVDGGHRRGWRIVAGAATVLGGVSLVGAGTRAAWAGGLAGGAVALGVTWRRTRDGARMARRRTRDGAQMTRRSAARHRLRVAAAVAVTAAVVVAVGVATTPVADRVGDLGGSGGGIASRLDEWRLGWRVVAGDPALGVGPEGYRIAVPVHVDDAYERAHGRAVIPDRAHSGPLDVAASLGVAGLIAFAALVVTVAPFVWRALRHGRPASVGVAAAVVAYSVQQLFLFPLAELDPLLWLLVGMLVAAGLRSEEALRVPVPRIVGVVTAVAAVVVAVAAGFEVLADRQARASVDALRDGQVDDALDHARRAVSWRPDSLRYRVLEADVLAAPGTADRLRRAVGAVDGGLDVSPDDPVLRARRAGLLLDLARVTGRLDDAEDAYVAWAETVETDPANGANLLDAGAAAAAAGRPDRAEAWWRRAGELAPDLATPWVNVSRLLLGQGRVTDARAAAERAVEADPADPAAREAFAAATGAS